MTFVDHTDGMHAVYADEKDIYNIFFVDVISEKEIMELDYSVIEIRRRYNDGTIHLYNFKDEWEAAAWLLGYNSFAECAALFEEEYVEEPDAWLLDWVPTDKEMAASEKEADPYYFEDEED